jgi:hypothetical protein
MVPPWTAFTIPPADGMFNCVCLPVVDESWTGAADDGWSVAGEGGGCSACAVSVVAVRVRA